MPHSNSLSPEPTHVLLNAGHKILAWLTYAVHRSTTYPRLSLSRMQIMQTFVNLDAGVAITAYVVACGIVGRLLGGFVQCPWIDTCMIFAATHMTVSKSVMLCTSVSLLYLRLRCFFCVHLGSSIEHTGVRNIWKSAISKLRESDCFAVNAGHSGITLRFEVT
jgi:hypothetical protein